MKSWWQNALVVAVIAAVIGGLFTLAPIVYDMVTNRKLIVYEITYSGVLNASSDKQIIFVSVTNSGTVTVSEVLLSYERSEILISDFTLTEPFGVDVSSDVGLDKVVIEIDELNPEEGVNFAFLVSGNLASDTEVISARARGMSADQIMTAEQRASTSIFDLADPFDFFQLLMLFAAALTVTVRFAFGSLFRSITLSGEDEDRETEINFIGSLLPDDLRLSLDLQGNLTYAQFADLLYLEALKNDEFVLQYVKALGCLVRCQMAKSSKEVVKRHLELLLKDKSKEFIKSCKVRSDDVRSDFEAIFKLEVAEQASLPPKDLAESHQ